MSNTYTTKSLRGQNMLSANPRRMDYGNRRALGRTVKGETRTPGCFVPVEVWTLKEKRDGKWFTVDTHCSEAEAKAFVHTA